MSQIIQISSCFHKDCLLLLISRRSNSFPRKMVWELRCIWKVKLNPTKSKSRTWSLCHWGHLRNLHHDWHLIAVSGGQYAADMQPSCYKRVVIKGIAWISQGGIKLFAILFVENNPCFANKRSNWWVQLQIHNVLSAVPEISTSTGSMEIAIINATLAANAGSNISISCLRKVKLWGQHYSL